jgi:transposase
MFKLLNKLKQKMANKPINMGKIRHILRLFTQERSKRKISALTGVSRNTLKKYIAEFTKNKLSFEEINTLSDKDLEDLFILKTDEKPLNPRQENAHSFFPYMDKELKRRGVTRHLMWEEYRKSHPDGLALSQFKNLFREWKNKVSPVMHIEHKAGDKMFIDFAGEKLSFIDEKTGEIIWVEVSVAVLGASQMTYVEAVMSQQKEDLIMACENALHFFGGVPFAIVPDNLKSAVTKSSKYEPTLNETFADFASHYSTAVLPARAYKPKDKALVEGAVKISYTRINAKLRNQQYFSLEALNAGIKDKTFDHNKTPLTGKKYSRFEQYDEVERHALQPLPLLRYEFKKQAYVTVMKNGHVSLADDRHYYSVPFGFIGKKVKIMYSRHSVEVFYNYERIALHKRLKSPYNYTTEKEHMASSHQFVADWTPEKFISWAEGIHKYVKLYIEKILDRKQHPEQAYKSCVGILSFTKKYGNERLAKACERALGYEIYNYKTIQTILEKGMDSSPMETDEQLQMPLHENIRGENYYK